MIRPRAPNETSSPVIWRRRLGLCEQCAKCISVVVEWWRNTNERCANWRKLCAENVKKYTSAIRNSSFAQHNRNRYLAPENIHMGGV